jgi:hypothetical protein
MNDLPMQMSINLKETGGQVIEIGGAQICLEPECIFAG